jgi:hypothetical protein
MLNGLPSLSRMGIKALEIAGAGLTSALVAYLIGRFGAPAAPTAPPPPAVVQLAPADEEMMRSVRSDQAALLDQLRSDSQTRKTQSVLVVPQPQAAAPPDVSAANGAAKPAKSTPPVARKEPKPERARTADAKPRVEAVVEQPLQIQPPIAAAADPTARNAGQPAVTAVPATTPSPQPQTESKLASAFKWLLPSRDHGPENVAPASVPRPPKAVGEFLPSEM